MHNIYRLYIMDAEQKQSIAEKEDSTEITPMNVPSNLEGRDIYVMYLGGEGASALPHRLAALRSPTTAEKIGIGENRLRMKVKVVSTRIYPPRELYLWGDILQPPQLAGTRAEFIWPRDRFSLKPFTSLADLAGKYKRRQQLASFKKRAGIWKEAYDKSAFLPGFPEHGVTAGVEVREAKRRFDQLTGKVPESRPFRPQRPDEPDEYYRKQQLRYSSFPDDRRRERYIKEQGKTVERAKRRQLRLKAAVKRRRTQRRGGRRRTRGRRKRAKRSRKRGRKRRRTGRRKRRW